MTILSNISWPDILSWKCAQAAILTSGCLLVGSLLPANALVEERSQLRANESPVTVSTIPIRQRTPTPASPSIQIESFGFEDLPEFAGPGCRLLLATDGSEEGGEDIVFVTLGADDADGVFMRINGEFLRLYLAGDPIEIDRAVYSKPYESEDGRYYLSALLDYSDDSGEYTYMAYGTLYVSAENQPTTTVSAAGMTCH